MVNTSQAETSFDVAVIGAGASGTLVAAQFDRLAPTQARLVLIGSQPEPARGVAYDTPYQVNLLNVPAGNMSAFPDDRGHFTRWLAEHMHGSNAETFAQRKIYGDYLQDIFMELQKASEKVEYLNQKVLEISRQDNLWIIQLENGNILTARSVVLALGNLLLPNDPIDFQQVRAFYHHNPWSSDVTKNLQNDDPVLLIGTGLTMVDVALSLRETGYRGVIHAISRHGRLYQMHAPYGSRPLQELPDDFNSPVGALRWIRKEIKNAESTGNNWRAVIDSLRPHTASIWQRWNLLQRKTFLRHLRNYWDTHRHRMAPKIADQLSQLIEDHTLVLHRGTLLSAQTVGDKATILWKDKETNEAKLLSVARIVNCTGPERDITKVQSSLVSNLLTTGWISPDPLKLGLKTDTEGHLYDKNGNIAPGLYTLGPLRIAGLWESIAIPEIRCQAQSLAQLLSNELIEAGVPA